jgi:hypothetical protein
LSRCSERSQAAIVPRRDALLGSTFETMNSLSRCSGDGLRNHKFGVAIHLGRIYMGHAELDAAAQCRDRALAVAAIDVPGALPDQGDVLAGMAEDFRFHAVCCFYPSSLMSATSTVPVADSVM